MTPACILRAHCRLRSRLADAEAGLDAQAWSEWIDDTPAYARRACPDAGRHLADAARHTAALARRYHGGRLYGCTVEADACGMVRLVVGLA